MSSELLIKNGRVIDPANGVDQRTARRNLNRFVELDLARRVGSGPATEYEVA